MASTQNINCWIITEGLIGTENQCIGVSQALGVKTEIKRIGLKQPWRMLSPYLGFECACTFDPRFDGDVPWPDLLITSGRKAIAASRYIKKASGGRTFTVHIQDPRISPKYFDLLAVPAHDPARGDNVVVSVAAPNKITEQGLRDASSEFSGLFDALPSPHVAVMIGGNSKAHKLTPEIMARLVDQLRALSDQGYGLMITTSRRTGAENEAMLHEGLEGSGAYIWDGQGNNPYLAMLGRASFMIVTNDSTSMLSDAGSTGKPVYMVALEGGGKRLDKLHDNLRERGVIRDFEGVLEAWEYEKLNDAQMIADSIMQRLDSRS